MSQATASQTWVLSLPHRAKVLSRLWRRRHCVVTTSDSQPPLRAELFSADQMELHGKALALAHIVGHRGELDRLLKRLDDNQKVLIDTCRLLTAAVKSKQRIVPAGEWLLDNFHLIEEQIRAARQHLPKNYSRELPRLAAGPSKGLPRVYDLGLEVISHGDGRIDAEALQRFVIAYQTVMPLTLGELWAIPIMLRLALIENLRRVGARISSARLHINQAQEWADQMMAVAERDPKSLILVIADMARSHPPMVSPFVAELARRLQGHGPALALPLTWIEQSLAEAGLTIEQLVLSENQQQAADQVSISNSIGSLRFLGAMDWRVFVETMSGVERVLRSDPAGVYAAMDFATRDHYRHVVDRLAKRSVQSEADIAQAAIMLAGQQASIHNSCHREAHVGFYLVDKGLAALEQNVAVNLQLTEKLRRALRQSPLTLHLGAIAMMTFLFAGGLLWQAASHGVQGWRFWLLAGLAFVASSQLASALANWFVTLSVRPQRLPRMDYSEGLPEQARTLVVVPTLLSSISQLEELLEALEVRFLGNRDAELYYALLTDWPDAASETLPDDDALLQQAITRIEKLNAKYREESTTKLHQPFLLLHRPRRYNAAEQVWMGFERKRGKLADLNALLRGRGERHFAVIVGDARGLTDVRYVITLDTDTHLPRDTACELIGAMSHPLNRPRYDEVAQRVVDGYGILQPRIAASLAAAHRSRYANLCGSEPGIDPYTRSVSDVYQDLFGEGSFIGKGIYEVDAFERALAQRLPDNRILSHDLLEGCYVRCGLISDIDLFEDYPAHYQADVARQRRWIRGDWQIAHWLLPRVLGVDGKLQVNPLSPLSRWKVLDNLRRSVTSLALLALLILGWCALPQPWFWTLAVLGVVLIPALLAALLGLCRKPADMRLRQHLGSVGVAVAQSLLHRAFHLACLPYEALFSLDAIVRTSWRMTMSHRGLLEWRVSSVAVAETKTLNTGLYAFTTSYRRMWITPFTALVTIAGIAMQWPALLAAAPLLLLWLAAPALACWLSQPIMRREAQLGIDQVIFLRKVARKTWAFFDIFVTEEDHWLPPDNVQQQPVTTIAHRTSPTNIGMALLGNLSAYDFGYLSAAGLLKRTANTFDTLLKLERHQGHFYNWYDTLSLLPLAPRYVSSVDSGNLAGHLLTLRAGLLALPDQPIVCTQLFVGLADTLAVLRTAQGQGENEGITPAIERLSAQVDAAAAQAMPSLSSVMQRLDAITALAMTLSADGPANDDSELTMWRAALGRQCRDALDALTSLVPQTTSTDTIPTLRQLSLSGSALAKARIVTIEQLAVQATNLATMDYAFLYDRTRHLLAVGYNVDAFRRDTSYYDLLASEARLACFVGIAQGQLPQQSWFALGRLLTSSGGAPILVSWSGSMFEYLMPMLVMPSYEGTLLDQTCRSAVARQIAYGQQRGLPWGVSESGYNTVDANLNYQYHAFGVPGLGLKRGLAEDSVVAPYASALALMVAPEAACANMQRLSNEGLEGRYGFYEAVDYTPSRLPNNEPSAASVIVQSFMAHHQGMSLLALAYLLLDRPMQKRFIADPQLQATLLLLQERIPKARSSHLLTAEQTEGSAFYDAPEPAVRVPIGAETPAPEVQLLSNGRYHVMVSNTGSGSSRWKDLAVSRWREDATRDHWGSFLYLRDTASGDVWSAGHQPTLKKADRYEAVFSEGRAEIRRSDHDIESYCEIVVSPEDDIELRRLKISNHSRVRRVIEITSYAEVVLAPPAADAIQTSFGNLFVQTEVLNARHAILCTRRPRSVSEAMPWMFHRLATNGSDIGMVSYETDRMRFIGRGNTLASPQAMRDNAALSGTDGSVLDPCVAIRCHVVMEPHASVTLDWLWGIADSREACLSLVDKYQDRHRADRVFDLAWTHTGVTLRQINATEADAQLYRRLAGAVLYANPALRADASVLIQNRRGQSGLWAYAISGDLPIVLLKIADAAHIELARQMIQCHAWWRLKGLAVDLVIWNEDHIGYRQVLQDQLLSLVAMGIEANIIDRPGGIFVRSAEQISHEDRVLLQTVARVVVADRHGTLAEQVNRRVPVDRRMPKLVPTRSHRAEPAALTALPAAELLLANPLGGFSADGREYHISTTASQKTPAPWVNVIANPHFGTVITESGHAYTWGENAHEFRLTPWSDDLVGATGGEALYLRDEESGYFWSPTPLPASGAMPYLTRHGFGYSVFEHTAGGIRSELTIYVDLQESVKFSVLRVRNGSGRTRRLSATGYVEWVLGDLRPKTATHVVSQLDPESGALFVRNAYNSEFWGRVAFLDIDDLSRTLTGDRNEFLGRTGTLANPDAMSRARLSGRLGAGLDPCGAIQIPFDLADGDEREIIFRLGVGRDVVEARTLVQRFRKIGTARDALAKVRAYWAQTLGTVQVQTPEPAFDVLANGWLLYQTLACRLWARSGFYQSGGAFGFRDQLQDVMALVHAQPALVREHLLRSAEHQFPEGDVQHWWHPPQGRGVRTRCSDDYLWLPLAVCRYVHVTEDRGVLDEPAHFLEGRLLGDGEESYYDLPGRSAKPASLYEHCVRAIQHGMHFGDHGLPLIGSGDWSDGFNLVGIQGRGESVWLGFFLYEVLTAFAPLAGLRNDVAFAARCSREADELRRNLDLHAWDGTATNGWYRRAWFDDGTPLGSASNDECRIDSLPQSWAVLSGAGNAQRNTQGMEALDQQLVKREAGLVQLLTPPFDKTSLNPGYIKGYVPGVRENGGQYTHAAIWAAMAFAKLGDLRAWELATLINPVNHTRDTEGISRYKTEPYVLAADVYAQAPHTGRGGWTWYTGSASWMYRLMIECLLGLVREGGMLTITPCLPRHWPGFTLRYRLGETTYQIAVVQKAGAEAERTLRLDGVLQDSLSFALMDDGLAHRVEVNFPYSLAPASADTVSLRADGGREPTSAAKRITGDESQIDPKSMVLPPC